MARVGYGITSSDGVYRMRLMPGTYTLSLWSADSGEFRLKPSAMFKFWKIRTWISRCRLVASSSLDASLIKMGQVMADRTIVVAHRLPTNSMSEIDISAYDESTGSFSTSITDPGGTYSLVLPLGTYDFTLNDHSPAHFPPVGPQFPEQHIANVVVERTTPGRGLHPALGRPKRPRIRTGQQRLSVSPAGCKQVETRKLLLLR